MSKTRSDYRLFGGDASKQRATDFAAKMAWRVYPLDKVDPERFGLDIWCQDTDGIRYDYVAIQPSFC